MTEMPDRFKQLFHEQVGPYPARRWALRWHAPVRDRLVRYLKETATPLTLRQLVAFLIPYGLQFLEDDVLLHQANELIDELEWQGYSLEIDSFRGMPMHSDAFSYREMYQALLIAIIALDLSFFKDGFPKHIYDRTGDHDIDQTA